MTGQELFNKVFAKEIEEYGEFEPHEIEDLDGVTCFEEYLCFYADWHIHADSYIQYIITFRYEGKKYSLIKREHTSDNVSDTDFDLESFHEVVSTNGLDKAIDEIIKGIEGEAYDTWEEIVQDLEGIKKKFAHLNEV